MITDVEARLEHPGLKLFLKNLEEEDESMDAKPEDGDNMEIRRPAQADWLPEVGQWLIAIFTASERCKGPASKYAPWMEVLPECPNHYCLTEEDVNVVTERASLFNASEYARSTWNNLLYNRKLILERANKIYKYLQQNHETFRLFDSRTATVCSEKDLLWGLGMAASRDFRMRDDVENEASKEGAKAGTVSESFVEKASDSLVDIGKEVVSLVTVPFADMPNHHFDIGNYLSVDDDENGNPNVFRMYAVVSKLCH